MVITATNEEGSMHFFHISVIGYFLSYLDVLDTYFCTSCLSQVSLHHVATLVMQTFLLR